jgi:hypothetical protein
MEEQIRIFHDARLREQTDRFRQLSKRFPQQCGHIGRVAEMAQVALATRMVKGKVSVNNRSTRMKRVAWTRSTASAFVFLAFVALLPDPLLGQAAPVQIPASTPLSVQLPQHVPMKAGEPLQGRLLYPVYVDNGVAMPAGTVLRGRVIRLAPDRSRRIHSRLRGDFTPFHIPVVRFDQLVLPDGTEQPIASNSASDGVPILRLSPPAAKTKGGFIRRQIADEKQRLKDTAALFTKPGRGDRLVQFLYTQLPYHPERIESETAWTVELGQPLDVRLGNTPQTDPKDPVIQAENEHPENKRPDKKSQEKKRDKSQQTAKEGQDPKPPSPDHETEWRLRAYLQQTISSANRKPGDTFQARVAEPVFGANHAIEVPEGSVLIGQITQAKAARSFGRQGKLRFRFRELDFPSGFTQPVEGTLAGADSNKSSNLQMDSEGGVQPKSQNRVIVPLVLTLLAGRALDDDGSAVAHGAVASNGFGIVGRVVGMAASSRNVAAGIGVYGAALSFYDLWLARGHDVVFVKNTRIEITTTPTRSPMTAPRTTQNPSPSH